MQNQDQDYEYEEFDPNEAQQQRLPRPWARRVFMFTMLVGTALVLFLYGMYFDEFSETELVNLSFVWIACIAFGFSGLEMEKKGKSLVFLKAFGIACGALFLLFLFFSTMWAGL